MRNAKIRSFSYSAGKKSGTDWDITYSSPKAEDLILPNAVPWCAIRLPAASSKVVAEGAVRNHSDGKSSG